VLTERELFQNLDQALSGELAGSAAALNQGGEARLRHVFGLQPPHGEREPSGGGCAGTARDLQSWAFDAMARRWC